VGPDASWVVVLKLGTSEGGAVEVFLDELGDVWRNKLGDFVASLRVELDCARSGLAEVLQCFPIVAGPACLDWRVAVFVAWCTRCPVWIPHVGDEL